MEGVEPDVARVLAEEREETALRKAEMEANKAQVLVYEGVVVGCLEKGGCVCFGQGCKKQRDGIDELS